MKKIFTVVVCILCCFGLFAFDSVVNCMENFTEDEKQKFLNGEYLEARSNRGQEVFRIAVPGSEGYELCLEASQAEHSFSVGVTQYIKYPDSFKGMSEMERLLDVYNRMLKISTMKGVKYKSFRAGDAYRTLFSNAYMVESPDKLAPLADPSVKIIPSFKSYYACLNDTKFGNNIYIADYSCLRDEICIEVTNYNPIKYLGIKCIDSEDLHMFVDVKLTEEGIVVFAFAVAYDTDVDVRVLFTTVSLDGAFATRIKALKDWFISRMAD